VKLAHLFGFITKKFVTMHGHMNVKNIVFDIPASCFLGYNALVRTIEGVNVSIVSFPANI
jgi:hypothetical protein